MESNINSKSDALRLGTQSLQSLCFHVMGKVVTKQELGSAFPYQGQLEEQGCMRGALGIEKWNRGEHVHNTEARRA